MPTRNAAMIQKPITSHLNFPGGLIRLFSRNNEKELEINVIVPGQFLVLVGIVPVAVGLNYKCRF